MFLVAVLMLAAVFAINRYLPYEDKLKTADAIFVLDGEYPFRIWTALDLYNQGYAPLIIFPHVGDLHGVQKLAKEKRGYGSIRYEQVESLHKPFPLDAIRIIDGTHKNTAQELPAIFNYTHEYNLGNIILVTSDYHARRVRILADQANDHSIAVIVRMTPYQAMLDDMRWMKRLGTLQVVLSEFAKVMYLNLSEWWQEVEGFPPLPPSGLE